ncbi:pyridoxal phosphate-dependent aminotransferase [Candidatus Hodarchaeum mangrovi]
MIDYNVLRKTGAGIFKVLAKAKDLEQAGKKILHFEIGQPYENTPEHIKQAAKDALDENFTGYVESSGIHELKEAIRDEVQNTRGFKPSLNQVLILPGANSGVYYALRAVIDNTNQEIIYPNPGFPTYGSVVSYLNAGDKAVRIKEENEFRLNPIDLEDKITINTKIIILNSPQNPTGSVMKKQEIQRIAEFAEEHNFYILSDEIYSKMIYDEEFYSCSVRDECRERTLLLDGFSKSYSMTGWRLGWIIAPEKMIDRMNLLISIGVSCTSSFIQKAGTAALKGPQDSIHENMIEYRKRRETIVKGLNEVKGFSCLTPQGAFYVFPNIIKTGMTSQECADHLLNHGIACLPGTVFGSNGEGYLRFSYATSIETIKKGIKLIKNAFE